MSLSAQKKRVVVLGSTGSIGTNALQVALDIPDRMEIVALAAANSIESLAAQAKAHHVQHVGIYNESLVPELRKLLPNNVTIYAGAQGLIALAELAEADMILISIVGTEGLKPALAAIHAGKDLAIASKEILVMAGEIIMKEAKDAGIRVLPVDSEHNAIFQCLEGHSGGAEQVSRLILTASGGPFREWNAEDLSSVTLEQALCHPTWSMGQKITIDSATLFNKGLEMIEARWLFNIPMEKVDVIVHPQSIVHSMVEFCDGSVLAQMSHSDMCFPIQYAVTWPDRVKNTLKPLDFADLGKLIFEKPRWDVFPALALAKKVGTRGGTLPAVYNAANEVAVERFVRGDILFVDIWALVRDVIEIHDVQEASSLDIILEADTWARHTARAWIKACSY